MYIDKNIEEVIEDNSMLFSQYVIKNRALPDLYSGMKPIHLKILWSMFENRTFNFTKSATVQGRVMAYSPHGDCYETIVHMVQKDRHIYNLIDGQGNWGSSCSTKFKFAAQRYTECKMSDLGLDCLQGISKNMIEMIDNYDSSNLMPRYLPTRFPLILCMASSGIAVGMANTSPSFNLEDVCNATITHLKNETIPMLIPDFATGGCVLNDTTEIQSINLTGSGNFTLRAKYRIEGNTLVIYEIPYGVKISVQSIIEKIIERIKKSELKEVIDVYDQTGIKGLSIEITCRKGVDMEKLMSKLFALTPLESNFSCNMNVLLESRPMVLGVHDTIREWTIFRQRCMVNGLNFDIAKLEKELHFLHGLRKVLVDIDKAVDIIRHSDDIINDLMNFFSIDETQANSIINIKLGNINEKYVMKQIAEIDAVALKLFNLKETVKNPLAVNKLIIEDLKDVIKKFKKPRRTTLIEKDTTQDIKKSDLIDDFSTYCILTKDGYLKKLLKRTDEVKLKDNDEIIYQTSSSNKSTLLLFSNKGACYKVYQHELEECRPSNYGEYLPNILSLGKDEFIISMVSTRKYAGSLMNIFENGLIAKVKLESFKTKAMRSKLEKALNVDSPLLQMIILEKEMNILLATSEGKVLIFNSEQLNPKDMKDTKGVVAINLGAFEDNMVKGYILNVNEENSFVIKTSKKKKVEVELKDIMPNDKEDRKIFDYLSGNIRNSGSFIYNCRAKNDKVVEFTIDK